MRATILVGLILVALGGATLYQIRNGFFMYLVGHLTHAPPADAAAASDGFKALSAVNSGAPGVTIGQIADVRVDCAKELSKARPGEGSEEAFRRFNLILLGVGRTSQAAIIPPDARRITELRRDVTMNETVWTPPNLNERNQRKLDAAVDGLLAQDAAIYTGLDLASDFGHLDLRKLAEVMLKNGEAFHRCVAGARY